MMIKGLVLSVGWLGIWAAAPCLFAQSDETAFSARHEVSIAGGISLGQQAFGSEHRHDMGFGTIDCGWISGKTIGSDCWYAGRPEFLLEVFGAGQYRPESAYVAGVAPMLRYNFTGLDRWVPFVDAGAGVTATDIGAPDLGSTFEFNLQAGAGLRYLFTEKLGATIEARFVHLSNAGIERPNAGVNGVALLVGVTRFF